MYLRFSSLHHRIFAGQVQDKFHTDNPNIALTDQIHQATAQDIIKNHLVSMKNKLVKICEVFSRIDSFSKKECTGRTRLMRRGI